MADIKRLQTRIALKHDTWANWNDETKGKNLVLLKGEIGLCEIPSGNTQATNAPTVLFKVGDGEHKFHELNWASALAADVYGWAKAEDVVLEDKTIKFVRGSGENRVVVKEIAIPYVTNAEVTAITTPMNERLAAVEAALGTDSGNTGSVSARLEAAEASLDDILGHEASEGVEAKVGLIDTAEAAAKAYTDEKLGTATVGTEGSEGYAAATGIRKEIEDAAKAAVAGAKEYTDAEVLKDRNRIGALEEADAAQDLLIAGNTTAIGTEKSEREAADNAINAKFGEDFGTEEGKRTVAAAIAEALQAGENAAQAVTDLNAGQVTTNKNDIAKNVEDISKNTQAIADEKSAREKADDELSGRVAKVEAFFANAEDADGNYTGLNDALDTLVEIQSFLKGDGEEANGLFEAINANSVAIEALEDVVGDANGGLVKTVGEHTEAISDLNEGVEALQTLTAGFAKGETVKGKIEAAADLGQQGIDAAAAAQETADEALEAAQDAQSRVGVLEESVPGIKETADKAKEDLAALTLRVGTAEGDIDALEAIVKTGADKNEALREAITELQGIVKTGADANATLGLEIDAVADKVNDPNTGLAKTKEIADGAAQKASDNAEAISAIQADYLKASDWFIIDCGTSVLRTGEPEVAVTEG